MRCGGMAITTTTTTVVGTIATTTTTTGGTAITVAATAGAAAIAGAVTTAGTAAITAGTGMAIKSSLQVASKSMVVRKATTPECRTICLQLQMALPSWHLKSTHSSPMILKLAMPR